MREIKFRAWYPQEKVMKSNVALNEDGTPISIVAACQYVPCRVPFELMQCIGLKDKNGKEIYERDIVRAYTFESSGEEPEDRELDDFTLHEVKWMGEDDYPAFDLVPPTDEEANSISAYVNTPDYSLEVVGNVWENPELVKLMKENQLI